MEKSDQVAVIPADLGWSDIGSWLSYRDLVEPDQDGNRIMGEGLFIKSTHTFIKSSNRIVAAIGVKDLIIIDTDDALLIVDQSCTQDVKLLVNKLKEMRITHKNKLLN
jgi:mannose-1-phosphate guanylyltransferase